MKRVSFCRDAIDRVLPAQGALQAEVDAINRVPTENPHSFINIHNHVPTKPRISLEKGRDDRCRSVPFLFQWRYLLLSISGRKRPNGLLLRSRQQVRKLEIFPVR